jgi:hypothetical protein
MDFDHWASLVSIVLVGPTDKHVAEGLLVASAARDQAVIPLARAAMDAAQDAKVLCSQVAAQRALPRAEVCGKGPGACEGEESETCRAR